jgi:hypothetical protein
MMQALVGRDRGLVTILALSVTLVGSPAIAKEGKGLYGCWNQASSTPLAQTPVGQEWGSRTWCFKPNGELTGIQAACSPSGGCDAWDLKLDYRWRPPFLSILGTEISKGGTKIVPVLRKCRLCFPSAEQMQLLDCKFPEIPWTRTQGLYLKTPDGKWTDR